MRTPRQRLIILIAALYQLLIIGCSTEPKQSIEVDAVTPEEALQQLYSLSRQHPTPQSEDYRLQAAEILIGMQRLEEANTVLSRIDSRTLPGRLRAKVAIVRTKFAIAELDGNKALQLLDKEKLLFAQQPRDIRISASRLRATTLQLLGRPIEAVRQLVSLYPLLAGSGAQATKEAIWSTLNTIPEDILTEMLPRTKNRPLKGWIALALLTRKNQYDLDRQLVVLNNWKATWRGHPAETSLPDELLLLSTLAEEQPRHVALMLPLKNRNGAAGKAIRDGFMAAYYAANATDNRVPVIDIIDTSEIKNILETYDAAIINGADVIIGPLDKKNVQLLQTHTKLIIPTLALNYGNPETETLNLYQFGLSAEEEARQAARHAWGKGYRNSLVLTPEGGWGERIAQAFIDEWQLLSGKVLELQHYSEAKNYSDAIREMLNINDSDDRAKRIESLVRSKIHFLPRRRADMDVIFIVGTPKQARQIKPTLAFHFAGNVPVYATSHIYSGVPDPLLDRDLDGILFCETPWMLNNRDEELQAVIADALPSTSGRLGRLYALGIDAYRLYPRLKQLDQLKHSKLYGNTGLLRMENRRIVRSLDWAYFRSGKIRPAL